MLALRLKVVNVLLFYGKREKYIQNVKKIFLDKVKKNSPAFVTNTFYLFDIFYNGFDGTPMNEFKMGGGGQFNSLFLDTLH